MAKKVYYVLQNTQQMFSSWDELVEAKKHVKNPIYKGFPASEYDLAYAFMLGQDITDPPLDENALTIYTDGSLNTTTGECSYAFILLNDSKEILADIASKCEFSTNESRNIVGECLGALSALDYAFENVDLSQFETINMRYDYNGVGAFATGEFKNATTEITRFYKSEIKKRIESSPIPITFTHSAGHLGIKWNEHCDKQAKAILGIKK